MQTLQAAVISGEVILYDAQNALNLLGYVCGRATIA
jgi:hypothetical protein